MLPVLPDHVSSYFLRLVADKTGVNLAQAPSEAIIRSLIVDFEAQMVQAVASNQLIDANPSYPLFHHFTDGAYAREMHIPAGHIVVGKLHRHNHFHFISKGRVTVLTEKGGLEEYSAGGIMISAAGVKRLLITHEDTVWTVIHVTNETDLEKIEETVIAKDFEALGLTVVPLQLLLTEQKGD
jgi:quercetin dioxygenase-like cupin family protein